MNKVLMVLLSAVLAVPALAQNCSAGCVACSGTVCSACQPGYNLANSACACATPNCQSCNSTACIACANGYSLQASACAANPPADAPSSNRSTYLAVGLALLAVVVLIAVLLILWNFKAIKKFFADHSGKVKQQLPGATQAAGKSQASTAAKSKRSSVAGRGNPLDESKSELMQSKEALHDEERNERNAKKGRRK